MAGFGAFGKIPGLGDFLRLNLPAPFVQAWDVWLQQGLVQAKGILGDAWNDAYMSAPIWRFTLPAGTAGEGAVSGILMASVDRVGRQYPLTLAIPHAGGASALTHFANRTVFERLEEVALAALDDGTSGDDLTASLTGMHWITPSQCSMPGTAYVGSLPAAQALAADSVTRSYGETALWSAMLEGNHRLLLTSGLPKGSDFMGLFDLSAPVWGHKTPAQV